MLACTWAQCDDYARWIFDHFANVRAAVSPGEFIRLLQLWIWSPAYVDSHRDDLLKVQEDFASADLMPQHAFTAQCRACTSHDTRDQLGKIKVPTLITVGDKDIFTPPAFSEFLHAKIPGSKLEVFRGTGHAHHWEALEAFNKITTKWLLAN